MSTIMMGHKGKLHRYEEWDAFTGWRKKLHWQQGELKAIKRRYNKRQRKEARFYLAGWAGRDA